MDPADSGKLIGEEPRRPRKKWFLPVAVVAAIIVTSIVWHFYQKATKSDIEPASVGEMAFSLPDKPSLAVLPFDNMSGDPEQAYVSDGITEAIIMSVSKIRHLFVIARNSTFVYKNKAVKVQQVAQDLGVQYVLEGSVQRSGDRLRVTAQLIDALNGRHIWAEQYDRDLKDLFDMQDEITMEILEAMRVKLIEGEQISKAKRPQNVQSALKIYQAQAYSLRFTPEAMVTAKKIAEEVVAVEPEYGEAYYILSTIHMMEMWYGTGKSPKDSLLKATEYAEKAISLDDSLSQAMGILGYCYGLSRQWDESVAVAEKGVAIDPNGADAHAWLGNCLNFAYRYKDAIPFFDKAMRLNPYPPPWYYFTLAVSHIGLGRYEEAITLLEKSLSVSPNNLTAYLTIIRPYLYTGREDEARAAAQRVLQINPKFSVEDWVSKMPYKEPGYPEKVAEALYKAGIPETPPLPLPDKPSIAVLAFDNLSGDPEQEYFSDGITEEIISALSKTDQLFVIARNSSFVYKGKPVNVKQVARELGVHYVLEGSVRISEDRVRITVQLIDAISGHHLWAERYDRDLKDIFALQDEITIKIVSSLQIKLTEGEQSRMWIKNNARNLDVKLKTMELLSLWREDTIESHMLYGQLSQEVIDMAPKYPVGYLTLAWHHWWLALTLGKSPQENLTKAFNLAQKVLSMDESNADAHALLGSIYMVMRQHDKAIAAGKRSIELQPNGAMVHGLLGFTLYFADQPDEGIVYLNKGIRLNPFPASWYFQHLGSCYAIKGQYEKALTLYKQALLRSPDTFTIHLSLAITYALLDRQKEADAAVKKVLELYPSFSIERFSATLPYKNQDDLKLVVGAMRKAGLPE